MLNIFINSTTFGQAMGATFDMSAEGSLSDKRVTDLENCEVCAPIYEKAVDPTKITSLIATGQTQKVSNLGRAIEAENVRVNSLAMLIRELELVASIESNEMIIAYVPAELLQELESGRVKFYLADDSSKTTYYSEFELNLWQHAMPLIQSLYCRLVFKNIASCRKNVSGSDVQADRVNITASMYTKLLIAFREMKTAKSNVQAPAQSSGESAFM